MAFCIKNFKYKKTDWYLTMKLQKAFTANNTKNNFAFRAHESASARASSLFTSLSCTINLMVRSWFFTSYWMSSGTWLALIPDLLFWDSSWISSLLSLVALMRHLEVLIMKSSNLPFPPISLYIIHALTIDKVRRWKNIQWYHFFFVLHFVLWREISMSASSNPPINLM